MEFFPFTFDIDAVAIASSCLWSLSFYLALATVREWIIDRLNKWFNFAERSLYLSQEEFDRTRPARESQNAFYASIFSIVPFLILGTLCHYGIDISLGRTWSISLAILFCISSSVYELGRRSGEN